MSESVESIRAKIAELPHCPLGFYPTPLERLNHLSEELGIELYMKREDFSGRSLFGGNKIRKLEYLMGDAMAQGAEYVFTFGATQSNHAMETVTACRQLGLKPVIYLTEVVPVIEGEIRANLLLDQILGAEIHIVKMHPGETEDDADLRGIEMARAQMASLEAAGHKCYEIPAGGANAIGSVGFADSYLELRDQMAALGLTMDYLFHATGTAGTMAGLNAAKKALGDSTKIISVNVSEKTDAYLDLAAGLANGVLERLGIEEKVLREDVCREGNFYQPGYEIPSDVATQAIRHLAQTEGILADPVYSGKAFAAVLAYAVDGRIPKGSTVVFLHTGGATALFAENEMVGDFSHPLIVEE